MAFLSSNLDQTMPKIRIFLEKAIKLPQRLPAGAVGGSDNYHGWIKTKLNLGFLDFSKKYERFSPITGVSERKKEKLTFLRSPFMGPWDSAPSLIYH